MTSRFDYYILDQYDDVWNDVPLPTFKQAWEYRNMILPQINKLVTLRIEDVPRGATCIFEPCSALS